MLAAGALSLVCLQVVLGGWSSANFASAACPGLLGCDAGAPAATDVADAFKPSRRPALDDGGQVVQAAPQAVLAMSHRLLALAVVAYLAWLVRRLRGAPGLAGSLRALSLFSIGQLAAGVSTVLLAVPLPLLTLHNALAAGLLLASVNLLHRLTPATGSQPPA